MAVNLNLLPPDYTVSKPIASFLKIARPLNVILLTIFLVSALGMTGFLLFGANTLKKLNSQNSIQKTKIQSLQQAQQQIVLLKDRLSKIAQVRAIDGAGKNMDAIIPYIDAIGENSTISEVSVDPAKVVMSVNFKTNSELTNFLNILSTDNPFYMVTLDSFSYGPSSGYLVGFSFVGKTK